MRQLKIIWLLALGVPVALSCDVLTPKAAYAQGDIRILYPQEGQDVRGEITARFEGIPAGGYATVKIDGQFRQASAQDFVVLDTLSDRVTFARGDGAYKMDIVVLNAGGKRVGTASVTFNVANNRAETSGASVRLVHWTAQDRLSDGVQRFRVFAESNATITGGEASGGGSSRSGSSGGESPGGGGSGGSAAETIPAPLDFQVAALMRRVLRDTAMINDSANISTIVQEGFERQREDAGEGGGGGSSSGSGPKRKKKGATTVVGKAPWSPDWNPSPEVGKFFVKMIQQNGTEINATRKAPSLAIADLLPTFPDVAVRPGSTWGTTMSFVGDLSTRTPINVKDAPMTFTSYEDLQTPGGENRRCAKLESRFRLPDNLAKRIAANLANKVGSSGGGGEGGGSSSSGGSSGSRGGGGSSSGGDGEGASLLTEDDILVARTDVARVIWFDVQRRRILRAEDIVRSNFEVPATEASGGGGGSSSSSGSSSGGGEAEAPAEPTTVDYNLSVTTWLDDRVPNPTGSYLPGGAGAHTRDSVAEPGLSRILRAKPAAP